MSEFLYKIFGSLSLPGAIIFILFVLIIYGSTTKDEKLKDGAFTAFTTFVSGNEIGRRTAKKEDPKDDPKDPK